MSLTDHSADLGRSIAFYPRIARFIGSLPAAIFLCQFAYWRERGYDGEIFKTQDEIEAETGLSCDSQRTAIRKLTSLGYLTVNRRGLPARNYYRFDWRQIDEDWAAWRQRQIQDTPRSRSGESQDLEVEVAKIKSSASSTACPGEPRAPVLGNPQDIKRKKETTKEITEESKGSMSATESLARIDPESDPENAQPGRMEADEPEPPASNAHSPPPLFPDPDTGPRSETRNAPPAGPGGACFPVDPSPGGDRDSRGSPLSEPRRTAPPLNSNASPALSLFLDGLSPSGSGTDGPLPPAEAGHPASRVVYGLLSKSFLRSVG